jgi:hypothetical protein
VGPSDEGRDSQQEAAEYLASMLEGLRGVANGAQMPFLVYLLNMALEKANNEKNSHLQWDQVPVATQAVAHAVSGKRHKLLPMPLQPAGEV